MGFGVLFFGYFLFINFAYYTYTDAIAAVLVWYAMTKLSGINKGFRNGSYFAAVLTVFGVGELAVSIFDAFGMLGDSTVIYSAMASVRYLLIGLTTILMLIGMREVAREVGLAVIAERTRRLTYTTAVVYAMNMLLEVGDIVKIIDIRILLYISVMMLFATLVLVCFNLSQIYACYAHICMPGQDTQKPRESRFGFVNAFRAHEEEKKQEYVDYKLAKLKKKAEKRAEKGKKTDEKQG